MLITMIKTQDKSHVMYSKTEIGQNFSTPTIAKVILGLIILDAGIGFFELLLLKKETII